MMRSYGRDLIGARRDGPDFTPVSMRFDRLDLNQPAVARLRPGLSVTAKVALR
ncbi:MAG: hypothetical protein ABI810_17345 [Sphingomonas bacterium]